MAFLRPIPIYQPIPITNISKIFESSFLLRYQKCDVFYAMLFFQKLKKSRFMS